MILKNAENKVDHLLKVFVPVWDLLINLFCKYKLNSIYMKIFVNILKIVAENPNEKILICIFIKLNFY